MPSISQRVTPLWSRAVRHAVVLTLVALAAAATTGCGGAKNGSVDGGRSAYVAALNDAQRSLTKRFEALQAKVTPTSTPAQDQRTLDAYGRVVDDTVRRLQAIHPPPGFQPLHRRFVAQVAAYGTALQAARRRLRSNDPRTVLAAQATLRDAVARAGARLNATVKAINDRLRD
jgi:hypothetical protein